jgi:hypothetical protein
MTIITKMNKEKKKRERKKKGNKNSRTRKKREKKNGDMVIGGQIWYLKRSLLEI